MLQERQFGITEEQARHEVFVYKKKESWQERQIDELEQVLQLVRKSEHRAQLELEVR